MTARPDPALERGASRGVPAEFGARLSKVWAFGSEAEPRLGLVWIDCPYPTIALGLERALEKEARVHLGQEPPKEGVPSLVVIYADDAEVLRRSLECARALHPVAPVLVFGPRVDLPLAHAALKAGARGFTHAGMTPDQMIRALEVVSEGEIAAPRGLIEHVLAREEEAANEDGGAVDLLSARQREILGLVAEGLTNAEVARRLYLTESTIKQHLRAAYKVLGVKRRTEAARLFRKPAHRAGYRRPSPC